MGAHRLQLTSRHFIDFLFCHALYLTYIRNHYYWLRPNAVTHPDMTTHVVGT